MLSSRPRGLEETGRDRRVGDWMNTSKQGFSNLSTHQKALEGLLEPRLLGPKPRLPILGVGPHTMESRVKGRELGGIPENEIFPRSSPGSSGPWGPRGAAALGSR